MKQDNPNKWKYDNVETIFFDSTHKDYYDIDIKMIKADDNFKLFILLGKDGRLEFNCLLEESNNNLKSEYENLKKDLYELSLSEFIEVYYKKLKSNL